MKVIGHRGAAGLAPENTYAGFDLALALGVDGIETDVQRTKDGMLVLFHGAHLDKTTSGTGVLQETTWHELQQLDAGSWFGRTYAGERVPLLLEMLQRYGTRTTLDLEIKQNGIEYEVLAMVEQLNLLERVAFTSRDFPIIARIKERNPLADVGYLAADVSEDTVQRFLTANMRYFCPRVLKITKELVDQWHASGLYVRACGVNTTEMMKKAIQMGVDGMTYDYPDELLKELGRL